MKVRVKLSGMTGLHPVFKGRERIQIDFNGDAVIDLLHYLSSKIESKRMDLFLNDQGEIPSDLLLLINGILISDSNRSSQRLHENDLVEIILAFKG